MTSRQKNNYAIGVFDSGLGGLTVVKQLIKQLPFENIVYFGDTARVPYGTKSKESIIRFSKQNVRTLLKHKVKVIVVACNSSSSYALEELRKKFSLPILGVVEPGAKGAVEMTKNNKVGVIATSATVQSGSYSKKIKTLNKKIRVFDQACPLFVPLAEEGLFGHKVTRLVAQEYLKSLKKKKIDTLILGCTHYPLLKPALKKIMGARVALIDSAREVALEVKKRLKEDGLERTDRRKGSQQYLISDKPQQFQQIAKRFLGYDIKNVKRCEYV